MEFKAWLMANHLEQYTEALVARGVTLSQMRQQDIPELSKALSMPLGHQIKLKKAVSELQEEHELATKLATKLMAATGCSEATALRGVGATRSHMGSARHYQFLYQWYIEDEARRNAARNAELSPEEIEKQLVKDGYHPHVAWLAVRNVTLLRDDVPPDRRKQVALDEAAEWIRERQLKLDNTLRQLTSQGVPILSDELLTSMKLGPELCSQLERSGWLVTDFVSTKSMLEGLQRLAKFEPTKIWVVLIPPQEYQLLQQNLPAYFVVYNSRTEYDFDRRQLIHEGADILIQSAESLVSHLQELPTLHRMRIWLGPAESLKQVSGIVWLTALNRRKRLRSGIESLSQAEVPVGPLQFEAADSTKFQLTHILEYFNDSDSKLKQNIISADEKKNAQIQRMQKARARAQEAKERALKEAQEARRLQEFFIPPFWKSLWKADQQLQLPLTPNSAEWKMLDALVHSTAAQHNTHWGLVKGKETLSFDITKIERIHNVELWRAYQTMKQYIIRATPDLPERPSSLHLKKHPLETPCLDPAANEYWLFHGTGAYNFLIRDKGYDPRVTSVEGMFGAGFYLAENSTKSNQYIPCPDCKKNAFPSKDPCSCPSNEDKQYPLMVYRTVLGDFHIVEEYVSATYKGKVDPVTNKTFWIRRPPLIPNSTKIYDSVFAESMKVHPKTTLKYREFILYELAQAYPEYLVWYRRNPVAKPKPDLKREFDNFVAAETKERVRLEEEEAKREALRLAQLHKEEEELE